MPDVEAEEDDGLGSLAQSGRKQHLRTARTTMFVIGGITFVTNLIMALGTQDAAVKMTGFGFAGVGFTYFILGAFIYSAPVACTILGLILYVAGWAISAAMNPVMLANGIVIKIIIVMALVRAIQAAIAYQREAVVL